MSSVDDVVKISTNKLSTFDSFIFYSDNNNSELKD